MRIGGRQPARPLEEVHRLTKLSLGEPCLGGEVEDGRMLHSVGKSPQRDHARRLKTLRSKRRVELL